jgi:hypothetical protein
LLQVPAGYLTDRYGVRVPYAISFFTWSFVSAATALAQNTWHLFGLRLLLGASEAIVTPASMRWISTNVEERQRGLAVGILFAGAKFGPAIGAYLAVALIQSTGWRGMFLILGLGSMVFLIPWLLLVKEDGPTSVASRSEEAASFGSIWRHRASTGYLSGPSRINYFNYFNLTWLPAYFVEHWKLSLPSMGLYTAFSSWGWRRWLSAEVPRRTLDSTWFGTGTCSEGVYDCRPRNCFQRDRRDGDFFTRGGFNFRCRVHGRMGLTTANYWALTQTLMPGQTIAAYRAYRTSPRPRRPSQLRLSRLANSDHRQLRRAHASHPCRAAGWDCFLCVSRAATSCVAEVACVGNSAVC